ncbi:unnamed protein product [Ectocarpus sp. CCAP 1310/34]|nr:unnamed protein product [Ectocarpus sp. CCAP 1310/34]
MQAEDVWENLHLYLWFEDRRTVARKKEQTAANARAKAKPVVLTGEGADKAGAEEERGVEGARAGEGGGKGAGRDYSAAAIKFATARALVTVEAARQKEGGGAEVEYSGKGQAELGGKPDADLVEEIAAGIKLEQAGGKEEEEEEGKEQEGTAGGSEAEEYLTRLYGEKPDHWLHPASFVFAGNEKEGVGLGICMPVAGRWERRERRERSFLEHEGLKLKNGAGGKHSRAEMKALAHGVNAENKKLKSAETDAALERRAFEALSAPPEDSKSTKELVESVKALTRAVVSKELLDQDAAERARWKENVGAMEKKLELYEKRGKGNTPEAQDLEKALLAMYDAPVVAPLPVAAPTLDSPTSATPSLAGGDGAGVVGGEVAGTEGGGDVNDPVEVSGEGVAGGDEDDAGVAEVRN